MEPFVQVKDLATMAIHNKSSVKEGVPCGCYHCCRVFDGGEVVDWVDIAEDTALCPHCGIDSVVANVTNKAFLEWSSGCWFSYK